MVDSSKRPKIVGNFIRERREALGLSQRALGLLFNPPVTTQFISNVERGVTPLPPAHIPTLTKALGVADAEITALLEKEYTFKLSDRLGRSPEMSPGNGSNFSVAEVDAGFMRMLYDAYAKADNKTKQTFHNVCESVLNFRRSGGDGSGGQPGA